VITATAGLALGAGEEYKRPSFETPRNARLLRMTEV
jgi:hypothetical protein